MKLTTCPIIYGIALLYITQGVGKKRYLFGRKVAKDTRICLRKKGRRSEEHTSELQSRFDLVCRLLLEKKKNRKGHRDRRARRRQPRRSAARTLAGRASARG